MRGEPLKNLPPGIFRKLRRVFRRKLPSNIMHTMNVATSAALLRRIRNRSDDATLAWFLLRLAQKDGCCELCFSNKPLVLDHHHTSGELRALICVSCNQHLGEKWEDPEWRGRALKLLHRKLSGIQYSLSDTSVAKIKLGAVVAYKGQVFMNRLGYVRRLERNGRLAQVVWRLKLSGREHCHGIVTNRLHVVGYAKNLLDFRNRLHYFEGGGGQRPDAEALPK